MQLIYIHHVVIHVNVLWEIFFLHVVFGVFGMCPFAIVPASLHIIALHIPLYCVLVYIEYIVIMYSLEAVSISYSYVHLCDLHI